jgi:hypothetical protein
MGMSILGGLFLSKLYVFIFDSKAKFLANNL